MDVGFFGTPDISSYVLEELSKEHCIKWVVTQSDKKKGRGKKLLPTPVKEKAIFLGIPCFQPEELKRTFLTKLCSVDLSIVVAYGKYIPSYIIDFPKYSTLNIHLSLLPSYRGAAPVARAILNGEKETGISIMKISKEMDAGDIVFQRKILLDKNITKEDLTWDLIRIGTKDLIEIIPKYVDKKIKPIRQTEISPYVSYAEKVEKKEGFIKWEDSAEKIHNKVRAFYLWPGTKTEVNGISLKITKTKLLEKITDEFKPGEIVSIDKNSGIIVKTGEKGLLLIEKVQVFGKKEMDVKDFINGYEIKKQMRFI